MTDPFEPYLATNKFGTTAAQIRGFAETTTPANTSLSTILDELDTSRSQVRSTIDGQPAAPTEENVSALSTKTRKTHRRGITFAAAMEYLATKVETHDSDINGLAASHPDADAEEAGELARPINNRLDTAGDDVAALLDGDPDAELTVKDLILNGFIPLGAADYWPHINANLTDQEREDAETARQVRETVDRLRGMTPEEQAEYLIDHPDEVPSDVLDGVLDDLDIGSEFGDELATRLAGDINIDSVADRERYEDYARLLGNAANNDAAIGALMEELGPRGLPNKIGDLLGEYRDNTTGMYPYWYDEPDADPAAELQNFGDMANLFAQNSALLLANGTRNGVIPASAGEEIFPQADPTTTILLDAANRHGYEFGGDFLGNVGEGFANYEDGVPNRHQSMGYQNPSWPGMGSGDWDPMTQLLEAGNQSTETAQGLAGNETFLDYMLTDRPDHNDGEGEGVDGFDDVLQTATIEAALDPDYSENAANISSNVIELGGKEKFSDHYDDEVGGIIATYIQDANRAYLADDIGTGARDNGEDAVPPYGINMKTNDLALTLAQVGDSEIARSTIGDATMRLNQVNLAQGANDLLTGPGADDNWGSQGENPFQDAVKGTSKFTGFMTDGLAEGMIQDGVEEQDARTRTAELFTLPLGAIDTSGLGKASVVGDYVVGQVKDQIVSGYVGEPVADAALNANNHTERLQQMTKLQVVHALASAETDQPPYDQLSENQVVQTDWGSYRFNMGDLSEWPRDGWTGEPYGPGLLQITDPEMASSILQDQEPDGDPILGIPGEGLSWVDTDWDSGTLHEDLGRLYGTLE